ncbi:hypothetical protein AHMF7605_28600 [Adhaeribacter arboris]|uniref:PKD domain-containing protein n=1 Tax=Adhaeribacter arboris TaxID=2072846 RepID=A0A2T2Y8P1_9BACT|nr:T9SS type A sorting domain-containing protein [Adhaeribacter arboris]PSR51874.1 hypothetical protein AHMF7605_28600 [Adhaeribacter arboris]
MKMFLPLPTEPREIIAAMQTKLLPTLRQKLAHCLSIWLLASLLLSPGLLQAQIYSGNLNLYTQADVDAFQYTEVTGGIYITGSDITNLQPLASLTKVGGYLNIQNCAQLSSLAGLENLSSLGSMLAIVNNSSLTSLVGLEKLTPLGTVKIENNPRLTNLKGLDNLTTAESDLSIQGNSGLVSLAGLENLTEAAYLTINGNTNLNNLSSLNNLKTVRHLLKISNSRFTSLKGLENLTAVRYLQIERNTELVSLAGLEKLTVKWDIDIQNNPRLSQCCILPALIEGAAGDVIIANNAPTCNSAAEIEAACPKVYQGDITLSTQAEVDAFKYTEVTGTLNIIGQSDIINLQPLTRLSKVGSLYIGYNHALSSLAGLENLTSVEKNLTINSNYVLQDLKGLKNLISVGGKFDLEFNPRVTTLAGQESLTSVGELEISNCTITSLTGLGKLTSLKKLTINNNKSLTSLVGLEDLTSVEVDLYITSNSQLSNLTGLENLTSVGREFRIYNNGNLSHLAGLEKLTTVGGTLSIFSNKSLISLASLEQLTSLRDLSIFSNPQLSQCCLLLPAIKVAQYVSIRDNATNCSSEAEIKATCDRIIITTPPQATTVCPGVKAVFRVEAMGADLTYQWQKNGTAIAGATIPNYSLEAVKPEDAGEYSVVVTGRYTAVTSEAATLTVKPALVLGAFAAPTAPVAINTSVSLSISYSGSMVSSAVWNWGDGTTSAATFNNSNISGSHKYTKAGTYSPTLTVTDACGQITAATYEYVVVYESGAITGAGGFTSPKQAYKADTKLTGTAVFGLYARYKTGTSLPEGSTLFAFKAGKAKMAFTSTSYETLTISGTKARYTGKGKINGTGNYGFLVSLLDGRPDKFRIKIWNKDKNNQVVYDNNLTSTAETADPTTAITGFILIQTSKAAVARMSLPGVEVAPAEQLSPTFRNYPNPFADRTTLEFSFHEEQEYTLAIYDLSGRLVSQLPGGKAQAGEKVQVEWQAAPYPTGVYLARLSAGKAVQHLKLVVK